MYCRPEGESFLQLLEGLIVCVESSIDPVLSSFKFSFDSSSKLLQALTLYNSG